MSGLDDGRIIYATYLESIIQCLRGRYVKEGCNVSANLSTLSVDVSEGSIIYDGEEYTVNSTNLTLIDALTDKDRIDVVVWDYNDGNPQLKVITGTRWITLSSGATIPITDRISDSQVPLAIVVVRAGATLVEPTDVIDVRSGLDGINAIGSIVSDNVRPSVDSFGDVGDETSRYLNGYFINLYVGDIVMENKYRISEYDDDGNLIDGFRVIDDSGKELFKVTQDGIYFKGNKIV